MTNTERIQANNAELREAIELAENLPDAGSGGTPTPTQEKTVNITENGTHTVTPDDGYVLSKVTATVNVPTGGTGAEVVLQSKTVTPTKSIQEVTADEDYTALEKVTVEAIPSEYIIPSGAKTITENGTYDVKAYENATINVPIPEGYIQPSGTLNVTENGTYDVTEKASAVVSIPEKEIVLQDKTIEANGTYTADSGYDGLGQVTVNVPTGGGNTESEEVAAFLSNTMEVLDNSLVTSLRTRVCQAATKLITVNLPNVTSLGAYAFYQCSNLKTVTLPKLTTISTQTWYMCQKLEHADC
jgi:hypothetical protein